MKNHKNKTKAKPPSLPQSTENPQLTLSEEAIESFEIELCWCIKQLQTALRLGKLSTKQVQDHTKALNTLMSNTAPLIKKRQVMRLSFGDYRSKMAEEDKRHSKINQQIKLSPRKASSKSTFIKKSACASNNGFQFSFDIPQTDEESPNIENMADTTLPVDNKQETFYFTKSCDSFKFNFDIVS